MPLPESRHVFDKSSVPCFVQQSSTVLENWKRSVQRFHLVSEWSIDCAHFDVYRTLFIEMRQPFPKGQTVFFFLFQKSLSVRLPLFNAFTDHAPEHEVNDAVFISGALFVFSARPHRVSYQTLAGNTEKKKLAWPYGCRSVAIFRVRAAER